jgi:A/G-specific adenine glycosylase
MSNCPHAQLFPDADWRRRFRRRLLTWFRRQARDLPWRASRDPFRVWVSEIMLQQTQVATVGPYFERFITRFPDVASLAAADEQEVLRLWEGLGYYRRARQMHGAAQVIVERHGGDFPRDFDAVLALPGIGRYTAGAVLSIAFDQRLPILEANSMRVLSRLLAFRGDPQSTAGQKTLWSFAEALLPRREVGTFNQAVMELGSEVCTPKSPGCDNCPAFDLCPTRAQSLQASIPSPKRKTRYTAVREAAVVVRRRGKVLVRQCGPDERWSGLWDFPRFRVSAAKGAKFRRELMEKLVEQTGVEASFGEKLTTIKHGVTRYRITLDCFEAVYVSRAKNGASVGPLKWVRPRELGDLPLSVTGRKIATLIDVKDFGNLRDSRVSKTPEV